MWVLWRKRRWRTLLNFIDRLPRTSAYFEAISQDEELAERLADTAEAAPKAPTRRMQDWSVTNELLTSILNRLGELTQVVAATGGAKPRRIPPAPTPKTAIERFRERRRLAKHRSLVARVMPGASSD